MRKRIRAMIRAMHNAQPKLKGSRAGGSFWKGKEGETWQWAK